MPNINALAKFIFYADDVDDLLSTRHRHDDERPDRDDGGAEHRVSGVIARGRRICRRILE